ncbi:hypothetical protein ACLK1T_22455 [Escherichia coli]
MSSPFVARDPATPGIRVIDIPFPLKDAFDALSWLASQQTYRNSTGNNVMVMKKLWSWARLPVFVVDQAQRFLRQHPERADLRVWG